MAEWTSETNLTVTPADRATNAAINLNTGDDVIDKFNELYPFWYLMQDKDEDECPYLLDSMTGKRTPASPYLTVLDLITKVTGLKGRRDNSSTPLEPGQGRNK